eukprot:TRINITY_DN5870_c0_g1_i1.p1 TRINITY_DN5870_c0_g1~~TRINITY_DN5870_c0_g1_i1.p1  ORF type:complete len:187 (-),score=52.59 TRINITY_DN5870_c0_g1_i1:28-588(-)
MYYALGPEMKEENTMEYGDDDQDDFTEKQFKYFTADSDEESGAVQRNIIGKVSSDSVDINGDELSDDSGTADENDWKGSSIPPDLVASASRLKVIRVEPRTNLSNISSEYDQDITDFTSYQVEAYTNLEDLLDEAWEESDFAPPTKADQTSSMNARDMITRRMMKTGGLDSVQDQCGPMCYNCSIM